MTIIIAPTCLATLQKPLGIKNQQGSILPTVLGILVLIIIISSQLTDSVLINHKTNNAFQSQIKAESQANFALATTEAEILALDDRPLTVTSLNAIDPNMTQIAQEKVWKTPLLDYQLELTQDVLTNTQIDWTRQPESWWQNNTSQYTQASNAGHEQNAFSAIEEIGEDFSGQDLGQARDHYSGPIRVLYQVTSRGKGGSHGTSRLRTIVAKIYR